MGAASLAGCGGAPPRGPAESVTQLAAALRGSDDGALARIAGASPERVAAARAESGAELARLADALERAPVEARALVVLRDAGRVELVEEEGGWRLDRGVLGRPSLARPVDAVVALHDALARSRAEALVAVMARAPRTELAAELERWIAATADPEALEVSVDGERALVVTPTGEQIDLVRESGEWRVLELR